MAARKKFQLNPKFVAWFQLSLRVTEVGGGSAPGSAPSRGIAASLRGGMRCGHHVTQNATVRRPQIIFLLFLMAASARVVHIGGKPGSK